MGALDGRVAIITGAGRGLGREHALLFASEGAKVVVNDLGGDIDGSGRRPGPRPAGGRRDQGHGRRGRRQRGQRGRLGRRPAPHPDRRGHVRHLHVLVNNAGILRDRVIVNMTEQEWDSVIHVHLKGHFCPTRFAAAYWREQTKAGKQVKASLIHTSSTSGLLGNPGQANYGAAKSGIATFSQICAMELSRYGVRSNAIAPAARTRLTEQTPGLSEVVKVPEDESTFDVWAPGQRLPVRGVPRDRGLHAEWRGVPRPGRRRAALRPVDPFGEDRQRGPLDGRRAGRRSRRSSRRRSSALRARARAHRGWYVPRWARRRSSSAFPPGVGLVTRTNG